MRRSKVLLSVCAVVVFISITIVAAEYFAPRAEAPAFLQSSSTNGYSALIQAANLLHESTPPKNPADYEPYLQSNRVAFAKLDTALFLPCEVPASFYSPSSDNSPDFVNVRDLANAALVRGRAAEARKHWNAAAEAYMQVFKLALGIEHGPLIYGLLGLLVERNVQSALGPVLRKMDAAARERACVEIKELNSSRITFPEIREREFYFMDTHSRNFIQAAFAKYIGSRKAIQRIEKRISNTSQGWDAICP